MSKPRAMQQRGRRNEASAVGRRMRKARQFRPVGKAMEQGEGADVARAGQNNTIRFAVRGKPRAP